MSNHEQEPAADNSVQASSSSADTVPTASAPTPSGLVAGPLRMGLAGLFVGLIAWQLMYWTYPFIPVPEVPMANPDSPTEDEQLQMGLVRFETARKNVALAGLVLGALGAAVFGLVEGISRGGVLRTLAVTGIAIVLGASLGAVGGYYSMTFQWKYWFDPSITAMQREIGIQGIFWIALAAGIGLGVALYTKRTRLVLGALVQTVLGAILFVIVYVPLAGIAFPTDSGERTVPYFSATVAVWALLGFGIMGLMLGMGRTRPKKTSAA